MLLVRSVNVGLADRVLWGFRIATEQHRATSSALSR
jgi:hypothetical protein